MLNRSASTGSAPTFGFGSNTSTNTTTGAGSTGFSFGSNNNTASSGSTGFSFGGASNASKPAFGQTNSSSSPFGQQNNTSNSSGGLFGQNQSNTTSNTGSGLFGGQSNTTSNTGSGLFGGQSNTTSNTGSGLFGGQSNQQSGGMFGSNQQNQQTGGGLFGQNQNQSQNQTGGLFGSNQQNQQSGGGLFGSNQSSQQSGGGLFGSNQQNQQSGGMFGQNQNQNQNQNQSGGGLFGGANTAQKPGGLFGSTSNTSSTAPSGGLFGQKPAGSTGTGLFGSNTNTNPTSTLGTGTGLFGKSSSLAPSASMPSLNLGAANTGTNTLGGGSIFGSQQQQQQPQQSFVASIDQPPYSLSSSVSSLNQSLGPLSSSLRRSTSSTAKATPTVRKKASSIFGSSLKAASSPRMAMSSNRNSPYHIGRKDITIRKSHSMLFNDITRAAEATSSEKERSMYSFRPKRYTDGGFTTDVKRLVINRTPKSLESLVGRAPRRIEPPSTNGHAKKISDASNITDLADSSPPSTRLRDSYSDPSPFRANSNAQRNFNMAPVRTAEELGYWISPELDQLRNLPQAELAAVRNLMIGRKGFGQVTFNRPVDLTDTDLSEILGRHVIFSNRSICVYPSTGSVKPPVGKALNVPATVIIENAMALDQHKKPITDISNPRLVKHIAKLRDTVESNGGEFITYEADSGKWIFRVPHFSIWGLPDDDDLVYSDEDDEMPDSPNAAASAQAQPDAQADAQAQSQQDFPPQTNGFAINGMVNGGSVGFNGPDVTQIPNNSFSMNEIGSGESSYPMDDTFAGFHHAAAPRLGFQFGRGLDPEPEPAANNEGFRVPDVDENILDGMDVDNSKVPSKDLAPSPPQAGSPMDRDSIEPLVMDHKDLDLQLTAPPDGSEGWLSQLDYAKRIDSPLAPIKGNEPNKPDEDSGDEDRMLTQADLDRVLFGAKTFENSVSIIYRKAAEELRLPEMFKHQSYATFQPFRNLLLTKDSRSELGVDCRKGRPGRRQQTPVSQSSLSEWFKQQFSLTQMGRRSQGIPLASPKKDLTFKLIGSKLLGSVEGPEAELWDLASLLFDSDELVGLPEVPYNLSEVAKEKIREEHRKGLLSKWLEKSVSQDVIRQLDLASDPLDVVLINLSGHRIQQAAESAINGRSLHLATVIPLVGSSDKGVRDDAKFQLDTWANDKTLGLIPDNVRKVYEFLSGNVTVSKSSTGIGSQLYLSEGLDWKRAFGLRLWYESTRSDPIAKTVQSYEQAFQNGVNRVAEPLARGSSSRLDVAFLLLKLYGAITPMLSSLLETAAAEDLRISWLLYIVLVRSSGQFMDMQSMLGDNLSVQFGNQLNEDGQWLDALFVYSHIHNETVAKNLIERTLSDHVNDITSSVRDVLVKDLNISQDLVSEVLALHARYNRDYLQEAVNLIQASLWEEAHGTVIHRVAPRMVIEGKLDQLLDILSKFEYPDTIPNWELGGQLYKDYASLALSRLDSDDKSIALARLVGGLSHMSTNTFDLRVASSIMSAFAGKQSSQEMSCDGSKILSMKMSEVDHLRQTALLSVTYFQNRLLAL
uniref:ARAD1A04004p n=1 Tax=Blastobotrys adeninivorans TaxID=409370 RepID=A0A060T2W6_BLAAD